MSDVSQLEAEASERRAKLQATIGLLQDKLTVSGVIDDFMGHTGVAKLQEGRDALLGVLRQHPLPILAVAAVIGFAISRTSRRRSLADTNAILPDAGDPYDADRQTHPRFKPEGVTP